MLQSNKSIGLQDSTDKDLENIKLSKFSSSNEDQENSNSKDKIEFYLQEKIKAREYFSNLEKYLANEVSEDYTDIFRNKDGLLYCFKDNACPRSPNQIKSLVPKRFKTVLAYEQNNPFDSPLIKLMFKST